MRGVITNYGLLRVPLALMFLLQSDAFSTCPLGPLKWKHGRVETGECYVAQHNSSDEIRFEVKDKANGTVQVEFPLSPALFYSVSLYVDENAAPATCSSFGKISVILNCKKRFHSMQRISNSTCKNVEKNCDPPCDLVGSVRFEKVYTGCYLAVVERYFKTDHFEREYSTARYLTTEYEKYPVLNMSPVIGDQENKDPESQYYVVMITMVNFTMLFQERLVIDMFLQNYTTCYFNHGGQYEDMAVWTLALSDNGELRYENKKDADFFQSCWAEGQNVRCTFTNMKKGNYCLGLEPDHPDQCRNSVWTYNGYNYNNCHIYHTFEVRGIPSCDPPIADVPNGRGVTIIATAIVLSLLSVVAVYCIIRFYRKSVFSQLLPQWSTVDIKEHMPKVLLLYAQDCEEFMNLMAVFRELLQTVGNCEVLDCFDPEHNDIASSPCDWMRFWASRPDTKVLVVASPCAMVHQKAMGKSYNVCYKVPLNYSDLFRVGLHEVMHNKQRKYSNTFVARFDDSDLDYIMHYTRYTLPLGVKELLKDLNVLADLENLSDSFILKKLDNVHSKLLDHYKRQPDYVTQILFRLKETV